MAFELKVLHTAPAITFCAENADKGTKEMINAMKVMRAVQLLARLSMARLLRAIQEFSGHNRWKCPMLVIAFRGAKEEKGAYSPYCYLRFFLPKCRECRNSKGRKYLSKTWYHPELQRETLYLRKVWQEKGMG